MAVANQTPYKEYIGNGTTKIFPLEFDCDDADHLIVKVNDIDIPALNNWSLNTNTGSVVFAIAPITQSKIILQRDTPLERNTDYQTYNNSFRPQPVNKDFDRIWLKLQELGHRDQLIWFALIKEITDRITGDKNLQNQINEIDNWLDDLQQNVNENTSDIAQLVNDLSKEIADRITNDLILKDMFLAIIDTAINEGTVNALAITYVDDLDKLNSISNLWDGRTVYVKDKGNYQYDALNEKWIARFISATQVIDQFGNTQDSINKSSVITIDCIDDLNKLYTYNGKVVYVKSYYKDGDVRGGGNFKYIIDHTFIVDNIFVFASSGMGVWVRQLDSTSINTAQAGIINDGSDQGLKIQALFDAAVNVSMQYGYTWKITIDGLEQRVWSSIPLTCNLTLLKLKDIWINSTIQDQSSISTSGVGITFIGTDAWVENKPDTWRRKLRSKALDNVTIYGLSKTNTVGVLFKPTIEGNFANYVFDGLNINGFKYDLVLSSNCYLMTFENCDFTGATERIFTYASNIGLSPSMQNMGENIRFNSCIFANSRNILDLNHESWITFNTCSFDYCGQYSDVEGWYKLTAGVGLNFFGCHFESGNENAQLGKYMFYTTSTFASVNIFGGTFIFNWDAISNDYIFYSTTNLNGNFQVDGLWCFGKNIAQKGWSNTKMGRFKISSNTGVGLENVNASGLQAINKSITKDARFIKSVLLNTPYDFWFVNGLNGSSTNQLTNANVTSSFGLFNDGTGTSYNALKITPTATEQILYCLIKRKDGARSNMSPVIRLSHFASAEVTVFARLLPVDVKFTRNAQGVEVPTLDMTRWIDSSFGFFSSINVSLNKTDTSLYQPSTRSYENIDSYEYFLLQVNFTGSANFDYIVSGLECYEIDV